MHFHWIRLHWCFRAIILNICPWILYFCENNEKGSNYWALVAFFKINYECFVLDFQFCMDDYSHILEQNLYVVLHVHHILLEFQFLQHIFFHSSGMAILIWILFVLGLGMISTPNYFYIYCKFIIKWYYLLISHNSIWFHNIYQSYTKFMTTWNGIL